MSDIRTKPATEEYREGWERVFGKKEEVYYCLCCGCELDFIPHEDGGFCSYMCEDTWIFTGGDGCNDGEET